MPVPGLVAVAGGKYTTYRVMARDAVDAAAHGLDAAVPPSATHVTPLVGAEGYQVLWNGRRRLAAESGLHLARIEHLLQRYGSRIGELLDEVARRPELGKPLDGTEDYLCVEAWYAAAHEGAHHLDDVLARRTRISIETFDRGLTSAEPAARLMGEVLGWSEAQIAREVEVYGERVAAERDSQEQPDDQAADAARTRAPEFAERGAALGRGDAGGERVVAVLGGRRRAVVVEALDRLDAPGLAARALGLGPDHRLGVGVVDEVAAGGDLDAVAAGLEARRGRSPRRRRAWTARPRCGRRCRGRCRRRAGTPRACRPRTRGGAGARPRRARRAT